MKELTEISFTNKVKNEIYKQKYDIGKQKFAFAYGMVMFGKNATYDLVNITTENNTVCELYINVIKRTVSQEIEFNKKETPHSVGNIVYTVNLAKEEDRKNVIDTFSLGTSAQINKEFLNYTADISSFLAGVFMVCGNAVNPEKGYHLEFSLNNEDTAKSLSDFLNEQNIKHKISGRRNNKIIYIKESEQIEDILAVMGATNATFELMDVKILKELRNKANRQTNCETANIDKMVNAASVQIEAINKIEALIGLSALGDELCELANIRINNPDVSLRELGENMRLPLSRSAVNHRMKKIISIAENLA